LRETGSRSPAAHFLIALQFLTIAPAVVKRSFTPEEMGKATAYFPLVGALIGAILVGANFLLGQIFPSPVRAALLLALWVLCSGALHLDGFLDACDGLLGGQTPQARLEIMRDERVGAFALAGGILLLLMKYSALVELTGISPALILAPVLSRWAIAAAIFAYPYARPSGLGKAMKDHTTGQQVLVGTLFAAGISVLILGWPGLAAAALALLVMLGASGFALRRIPGLTGDLYGTINELVEAAVLIFFTVKWIA
jgi:adenosylcobinamide-GDP ribazoletransferase